MKKILTYGAMALTVFVAVPLAVAGHHEGKDKKLDHMFERYDTDKDGTISKAEFLTHEEKKFSEMDANSSGDVTKEEAKAHHEMRKKEKDERKGKSEGKHSDSAPETSAE